MPLPAWMKGPPAPRTEPQPRIRLQLGDRQPKPDMWNGMALPVRSITYTAINYRLYDSRTGTLLSFNSTNSLACLVDDVLRTQREHPGARITAIEYDGPAYPV